MGDTNPFPGPHTRVIIPNKSVGLIIGKNGETVNQIHKKTNAYIFIPKDSPPGQDHRVLELSGTEQSVEMCKREIISMVHLALNGRLPYTNSLLYPFIDPESGLPVIDPGVLSQLDPTHNKDENNNPYEREGVADYFQYLEKKAGDKENGDYLQYNLDDYDDPSNYDIYYQSLYQTYPQMSDFYKKTKEYKESNYTNNKGEPFLFFNAGILDPESHKTTNSVYDPNFITAYNDILTKPESKKVRSMNVINSEKSIKNEEYYDPFGIQDKEKAEGIKGFTDRPEFTEKEFNKYLDNVYYSKKDIKRLHNKCLINDAVELYYNKLIKGEGGEEEQDDDPIIEEVNMNEQEEVKEEPVVVEEFAKPSKQKRSRFDIS